jgi:hypothetical protein
MRLDAMRIRAALMLMGVVSLVVYLIAGGPLKPKSVVTVEFGMYPDVFQGLTVEIDGEPAGTLQPFGAATRTGFEVKEGKHSIRVVHPRYSSVPRQVTATPGQPVLLIMDMQSTMDAQGRMGMALAWQ